MKVSEIAKKCGYEFCGKDIDVKRILYFDSANYADIAIVHNISEIESTKAGCILTLPRMVKTNQTVIYTCDSIELAAIKIAKTIIAKEQRSLSGPIEYEHTNNYFLGKNVFIGEGTFISPNVHIDDDVWIGANCFISPNVHISRGTIIKNNVMVGNGASIGARSFYHYYEDGLKEYEGIGSVVIEDDVVVGNSTTIQRGAFSDTIIGKCCKIGNLVDIGHDVVIGRDTKIVSQTGIASNVIIGDCVTVFGQVGIANNIRIGNNSTIYAKSLVTKNVEDNQHVSGIYAREHSDELRLMTKLRKL